MIEAKSVSKFFSIVNRHGIAEGLTAVLSVSLTIPDGKIVSFLGPSGCGKSTFLEIIAGVQAPTEGAVFIDGKQVLQTLPSTRKEQEAFRRKYTLLSPLANGMFKNKPRHDIAMIFQDYAVFPWMTALQNVTFALKLCGFPKADRIDRAKKELARVRLAGYENKYPAQLSGGMRQRLALARALAVEARIILMDEPFAALDSVTREQLQDDLLEIWEQDRPTIVLVTHDIEEAVYLSDEILFFSAQPGTIRNRFTIDAPRPRIRHDPNTDPLKERITHLFAYDIAHEGEYTI